MNEKTFFASCALFTALALRSAWSGVKTSKDTVKYFQEAKKREKRKTKRIFPSSFILWLGVKSNVEGNIHLAFVLFLLSVFKQNFTLESVFLRHKQKSFPCFYLPVTGWREKREKMSSNMLIFKHRNAICSIQPFLPWNVKVCLPRNTVCIYSLLCYFLHAKNISF